MISVTTKPEIICNPTALVAPSPNPLLISLPSALCFIPFLEYGNANPSSFLLHAVVFKWRHVHEPVEEKKNENL